ncbi:pleckstrin homology domain-containing family A member 4-like isoform X2 [Hemiscyllium ocellatum]|uniref:pleckstrin homology domain-containing family A member 4-like isoform X2 n=1 Tax=Hemiscyllium ocellatum TaxID=170820 RepID=UPI0029669E91|nr:pleckstrin homology domain-containing family A member 4-like isoform X2 [Hemiscyllium ocellatum]
MSQDRPWSGLSQTSSMVTISSVNTSLGSKPARRVKKVHTFAKREQAIKRDPNSVTVIRGWLHKQDSSGLKLWKRRWFVLSDFCLYYYRDSREERILGSIPMPSYAISVVDPQDRITRKFTFKAEHPGMRTYYFSADTQEDMNGWIRALSQSARVESTQINITSKRLPQEQRYYSFEDFTNSSLLRDREIRHSSESLEVAVFSGSRQQLGSLSERKLQHSPPPQIHAVPPPTPTSGLQDSGLPVDGLSRPGDDHLDPELRAPLSHVEEWVLSQKEKLPEAQQDQPYMMKTRSGPAYEHLADGYPGDSQLLEDPSITVSLGSGVRQQSPRGHYLNEEQGKGLQPESDSPLRFQQSSVLPSNSPDLISSRSIRSLRSNSLPVTSDTPRYHVLRRSHTPDDQYVILMEGLHSHRCNETPPERASQRLMDKAPVSQSSPISGKPPVPFPRSSHRTQSPSERSQEDMALPPRSSRTLSRPHTPVGRIDILPTPQTAPVMRSSYLPIPGQFMGPHSLPVSISLLPTEEQAGEFSISARARAQTLSQPYSRPQTPSDQFEILPSGEHYSFFLNRAQSPFRRQERSSTPFERMTVIPREELHCEGSSVTLPGRYSRNNRPHTPVERLTVLPGKEQHENPVSKRSILGTWGIGSTFTRLPPRPPSTPGTSPSPQGLVVKRLSTSSSVHREYTLEPVKMTETPVDLLLTRLCGQDRMLQALVNEATQLQSEKEKLEGVWEETRCQMVDFERHPGVVEQLTFQQKLLQEDLIQIRGRLCDLSAEMEQCWSQYKMLETELQRLRASRELGTANTCPQEQGEAQRDLWMIDDIFAGLSSNRRRFQAAIESEPQPVMSLTATPAWDQPPELHRMSPQTASPLSPHSAPPCGQCPPHGQTPDHVPERPPLPREVDCALFNNSNQSESTAAPHPLHREQKQTLGERKTDIQHDPATNGYHKGQRSSTLGPNRKGKMSAEEQMERMKRHQEAHLQERRGSAAPSQRRLTVSSLMREASPRASKRNSVNILANRPGTTNMVASRSQPRNIRNSLIKPTTASETPETPNVTASSKLMMTLSSPRTTAEHQAQKNNRIVKKEYNPSKVIITSRYIDADPGTPLSPEQLQEKERTLQKIKTMITKTSPAVGGNWASADRALQLGERERERIITLSYSLATEASQHSKALAAKALAEFGKQEEESDSPQGTGLSEETASQSELQQNGLTFNLGHHKETTNQPSGYYEESANTNSGQNSQWERIDQRQ